MTVNYGTNEHNRTIPLYSIKIVRLLFGISGEQTQVLNLDDLPANSRRIMFKFDKNVLSLH